jgi:hypothetical protein
MAGPRGHRQVGGAWSSGPWEPIVTNVRPPRHGPRPRTAEIRTETAHTQHEKVALRYAFHTNSLRQTFNRRVVQAALEGAPVTAVPVGGCGECGQVRGCGSAGGGRGGACRGPHAAKCAEIVPRHPPPRPANAVAGVRHSRSPVGGQRQRRGGSYCHDGRPVPTPFGLSLSKPSPGAC